MGRSKLLFDEQRLIEIEKQSKYFNQYIMSENTPTTDALKMRVIKAKEELPKSIIPTFVHVFKEYDNEHQKMRLTNVLQLRIADEPITLKLERLIEILNRND